MAEKQNTPEIRFEGFTDPWEQRKLGDVASSFDYGLNAAATEYDGQNKYLRITDIDDETHEFSKSDLTTPLADLAMSADYLLKEGDLLFARTGASVGKTYLYRQFDGMVYFAGFLIRARIGEGADPEFAYQATLTDAYKKYVAITSQRSGQPGVNAQEYADYQLMLPSKTEQQQIGMTLRSLDDLITLHQRKYDKLVVFKKSMLEKMFPKDGESVPEIRFAGFTDPWEQRKFSEIVDVCSGRDYKQLDGGPIPVYGTGGYMTSVSEALSHNRDAIGIGRKGTIDKPYLLKAPFWTVDTLFYAIPKSDINLEFALCSFSNVDWKSKDESTGLPSLSKESINETVLSVPNVVEQNHLGSFFADLDRLITLHQRKLELLQNIKKSLLDKMFA